MRQRSWEQLYQKPQSCPCLEEISLLAPSGEQEREQAGCKRLAGLQASNCLPSKGWEQTVPVGGTPVPLESSCLLRLGHLLFQCLLPSFGVFFRCLGTRVPNGESLMSPHCSGGCWLAKITSSSRLVHNGLLLPRLGSNSLCRSRELPSVCLGEARQ